MENKGIAKNSIVTIVVIIIFIIGIIFFVFLNKDKKIEYFIVKASKSSENILIEDYSTISKICKNNSINEKMENKANFEKHNVLDYFNEDYFKEKKLALISVYEDNSKFYIYFIKDVVYNKDKTEATIKYTYKTDGAAGIFKSSWYNYMFVELNKSVEKVVFQLDNENTENK